MIKKHEELINKTVRAEGKELFVTDAYGRKYKNPNDKDHGKYLYSLIGYDNGRFVRIDTTNIEIV
jgi:hypothetical protein